jgi:hypothetical protein
MGGTIGTCRSLICTKIMIKPPPFPKPGRFELVENVNEEFTRCHARSGSLYSSSTRMEQSVLQLVVSVPKYEKTRIVYKVVLEPQINFD